VVGPLIAHRAHAAGLVATSVEGDQPSLLIGLVSWARVLGLDIACAGKSSEYDFVFDPDTETVTWQTQQVPAPGLGACWHLPNGGAGDTLVRRSEILHAIPHRTVPDLCEMGVVANATGLLPDTPAFHVPIARAVEVPEVLCPTSAGGILARKGVIDVFNCLRRPDEQSFAGGVFITVRCDNAETWAVLRGKGIPVSRGDGYAMLYNPSHLLGVEAPISILSAALLGHPTGGATPQPRVDVVARAGRDWKAGETLAITDHHHHEVAGLDPMLIPSAPAAGDNPAPYYMAAGGVLTKDVKAGDMVTIATLEAPADSALWRLRAEQDALFASPRN
jgi:predicted homoserine dehydrogenase-like protein